VDLDGWVDRLTPADAVVALLAALTAFAYLVLLSRAFVKTQMLVSLALEFRRRRRRQEEVLATWGFAPRLQHYRRLEETLVKRLEKDGVRLG
jgi:hypothetical protein